MEFERFRPTLACPDCRCPLKDQGSDKLECLECKASYPVVNGVPRLLSGQSSDVGEAGDAFFFRDDTREAVADRWGVRRLTNLPNPAIASRRPVKTKEVFEKHVVRGEGLILNLGSGVHKLYENPNVMNLDISPHGNVDVVGDGMALPLLDNQFDGAVLDAVLEHVPNPFRVIEEVHRVLKPGGFVLAHAPFLYPYHGAPHDYFRYTDSGLRQVFHQFEEVECDTDHLPTRSLQEIMRAYVGIFADGRKLSFLFRFVTAWLMWPWKFLDHYLQNKAKSHVVVTGFSYLGRKSKAE
ncbi:MAG: methyltransferase domain-containing protein [Candidatus Eisenbacteria bacterium]|uniref:Methyltransferase domain-containing protein n=1 Tax=Eiseniibacteriota bacterium TaxID=2212470 RepID=A0A7Y2H2J1_UNCEI|nr:methyltransferase domain-containing protein [Candidatus Eisenbacteria bacterium]